MANSGSHAIRCAVMGMLAAAIFASSPVDVTAQSSYKVAKSYTSIVPRTYGLFGFGLAEASLGLTFVYEPGTECRQGECDGSGVGFAAYASASARKGQDDLFSNLAFNPGLGAGGRLVYTIRQSGFEYDVLYLSAAYSSTQLKLAELDPATTILSLSERDRRDLIGSLGYNRSFGPATVVGISFEARRELGSMGTARPEEVCVLGTSWESAIAIPVCSHRYTRETTEPLPNFWAGHARADVLVKVASLGSASSVPVFALVGAASVDKLEGFNTTYSWALGGAIAPAAYPGQAIVSVLAGFNDATNANGVAPGFHDRFVVNVTVGLPFEMILNRY